jgi:hypothetical protein
MASKKGLSGVKSKLDGRESYALSNGIIQLVCLTGGGHIAEFSFTQASGLPVVNPLWVPPWKTLEPYSYRPEKHASLYGPPVTGKMISGTRGHSLCLDYFGSPSEAEAAQGLSIHGEAPSARWRRTRLHRAARRVAMTMEARLPVARLLFKREIELRAGESVAYFQETVTNENKADHFFHWTQHVTLGPPFLDPESSRVIVPATKGRTFPHGYDGRALLPSSRNFRWPFVTSRKGGKADLTRPFSNPGFGFVATALLDPRREIEFVAAFSARYRVLIAYCFRRADFPWVAIWEENCSRNDSPWNGKTQARGLEFGSTPFPVGRREAFAAGPLFDTPTFSTVAARSRKTVQYVAFLAHLPEEFARVRDITLSRNEIMVRGIERNQVHRLRASGLQGTGLV